MAGSRCFGFSTSSSAERCPAWAKKVSTIRSRWRVAFRPRAAIQLARRSRAAAAEGGRWAEERFILKLILSLDRSLPGACRAVKPRPRARDVSAPPPPLPSQVAPGARVHARVAPREPDQRRMRPAPHRCIGVGEAVDPLPDILHAVAPVPGDLDGEPAHARVR